MQRNTVQRQIVLDTLKKLRTHPTVDDIYEEIHLKHPSISKTTVYRNLRQLASNGLIRQISMPDSLERYDGNPKRHYHFNCKRCRHILDINVAYLAEINDQVQKTYGFQVEEHDIVFTGICSVCGEKSSQLTFD